MRPQQNRRMRGRGSNNNNNNGNNGGNQNRKGPNPLTRSYESNGPDVKIRGSAQQIAEKYTTLARDAQTSGDRVMAENYLQHAEHYNRLIMAFQAQMPQPQQVRDQRDEDDMDEDEDGYGQQSDSSEQQAPQQQAPQQQRNEQQRNEQRGERRNERRDDRQQDDRRDDRGNGTGPQPVIEGTPAEVALRQGSLGQSAPVEVSSDNGEQPDQVAAVGEEEQPAAARRPRRPRRPKAARDADAAAAETTESGPDEPVTEAAQ